MRHPLRLSACWTTLLLIATSGCGTEGETPACDGYPAPYDITVPHRRAESWEQLAHVAAPPKNCGTLPVGFVPASSGSGGEPSEDDDVLGGAAGAAF